MDEPMDESMKPPTQNNISDAAGEAADEAEIRGHVQVFLDCDPEYRQAKITVEGMTRAWNPKSTETYCTEYTERAMPLTAVYRHEMIHEESRLNTDVAKDKISDALESEWELYVGYYTSEPEAIPRSVQDFDWAVRTAHGISGKRTVSLWRECRLKREDELYFLWVNNDSSKRSPPGAVQKVTDLQTFEGYCDRKQMADIIGKILREYMVVDDLNPLWSHNCFLHHMQYKYPPDT